MYTGPHFYQLLIYSTSKVYDKQNNPNIDLKRQNNLSLKFKLHVNRRKFINKQRIYLKGHIFCLKLLCKILEHVCIFHNHSQ